MISIFIVSWFLYSTWGLDVNIKTTAPKSNTTENCRTPNQVLEVTNTTQVNLTSLGKEQLQKGVLRFMLEQNDPDKALEYFSYLGEDANITNIIRQLYEDPKGGFNVTVTFVQNIQSVRRFLDAVLVIDKCLEGNSSAGAMYSSYIVSVLLNDKVLLHEGASDSEKSEGLDLWTKYSSVYVGLAKTDVKNYLRTGEVNEFIRNEETYTERWKMLKVVLKDAIFEVLRDSNTTSLYLLGVIADQNESFRVAAYEVLLEEMKLGMTSHIQILMLAHDIKNLQTLIANNTRTSEVVQHSIVGITLKAIKQELPMSVRNIVFAANVCLVHDSLNMQLEPSHIEDSETSQTPDRRSVVLHELGTPYSDDAMRWEMIRSERAADLYYIRHVASKEYLFASVLDLDQDRRMVFTWLDKNKRTNGLFRVVLSGDNVFLSNHRSNGYLSAGRLTNGTSMVFDRNRKRTWSYERAVQTSATVDKHRKYNLWRILSCSNDGKELTQ